MVITPTNAAVNLTVTIKVSRPRRGPGANVSPRVHIHTTLSLCGWTFPRCRYMATPSRPSTASARIRTKTSEFSDLFRSRQQHSNLPPPAEGSNKAKRKIPLFSLRKKSPATPNAQSFTPVPTPTPRPSTNTCVFYQCSLCSS
jgi:hypothetical protein